jgi:hypothetical protein
MSNQDEQKATEALKLAGKKLKEMESFLEKKINMPFLAKVKIAITVLAVGSILLFSEFGWISKLISASLVGALIWSYFYLGLVSTAIFLIYWIIQKIKGV